MNESMSLDDMALLAVEGGAPVRTKAFASWPHFDEKQIAAVSKVLSSGKVNYWTGEDVKTFEKRFGDYCEMPYAIAVANGTVALELILESMGIGAGDEVIVTPKTFIASASAVVMRGATPIFADLDRDSQNITAETIAKVITPRTRAIIAVHLAGWICEMDEIMALAEQHNLMVIEDCAQAHGARYKGRSAGSLGHASAFSFCQDKIMSTGGEGGMVLFKDPDQWRKAWAFKDHGKDYDVVHKQYPPGFRWLHEGFGTNMRMTGMQAALGLVQLGELDEWIDIRRANFKVLESGLKQISGLRVPAVPEYIHHASYRFYFSVELENLADGWDRDRIMMAVAAEGIPCFSGACSEIYLEKAFEQSGLRPEKRLDVASELSETSLSLLVHPTLNEQDMEDAVEAFHKVMARAVISG